MLWVFLCFLHLVCAKSIGAWFHDVTRNTKGPPVVPVPTPLKEYLTYAAKLCIFGFCDQTDLTNRTLKVLHDSDMHFLQDFKLGTHADNVWYTAYNNRTNTIAVSFRGSLTAKNWRDNAKAKLVLVPHTKGARLHMGWYDDIKGCMPLLGTHINARLDAHPTADIIFAGHSSGASYVVIAAFLAVHEGGFLQHRVSPSRISIITFGSPRIGNIAFARAYNAMGWKNAYRVVKGNDPTPFWPPKLYPWNYRDVGQEVYIEGPVGHPDSEPHFCNLQQFSRKDGSCTMRETFMETHDNPMQFGNIHLHYLNLTLGTVNCGIKL
jgi:Lipase (class 3)